MVKRYVHTNVRKPVGIISQTSESQMSEFDVSPLLDIDC